MVGIVMPATGLLPAASSAAPLGERQLEPLVAEGLVHGASSIIRGENLPPEPQAIRT